jgi:hypothetical protein
MRVLRAPSSAARLTDRAHDARFDYVADVHAAGVVR